MAIADDLARIALQEEQLQFASFDERAAWRLGTALYALATARNLAIVIDVRRINQQLFYAALPGTTPDNPEWVRRKTNVTFRLHKSSYAVGLETQAKESNLFDRYALPHADYACHGGCFREYFKPKLSRWPIAICADRACGIAMRWDRSFAAQIRRGP